MDPALQELLDGQADEEVETIIRLRRPDIVPDGVRVVARFGNIVTCRLRRDVVRHVWDSEAVVSVKASRFLYPNLETPRSDSKNHHYQGNNNNLQPPFSLAYKATGRGIVVGVIDWGCAFAHPNFRYTDGRTRLLALWDQTKSGPGSGRTLSWGINKYGYGAIYTAEAMNQALRSSDPYAALGYHPAAADPGGSGAHGTHVMDIAAGNGRAGGPMGVAPDAELVFVHLATRNISGRANLGDSVTVLEAIDFVAQVAGRKPWVINLSLGSHGGPHDGSTLVEQGLDAALMEVPGRAIVQSTGNYFDEHIHTSGQLRPGERRTIVLQVSPADVTPNELEIWYSGQDRLLVEIHSPNREWSWQIPLGQQAALMIEGQEWGTIYHRAHDPNNRDHHLDLFLYPGGPSGAWEITLIGEDVVDGCFHAWIERDAGCLQCQTHFLPEDTVPASTTGTICNGLHTITVGAYNSHSSYREVAPFSSGGPTRDGRQKPDLLAPGVSILAARSPGYAPAGQWVEEHHSSLLVEKSGTSMAAPHVTGTIACMFEAAQRPLWVYETRQLLLQNTHSAAAPQADIHRVGSGYLDSERAIAAAAQIKPIATSTNSTLPLQPEIALVEQQRFAMTTKKPNLNQPNTSSLKDAYEVVAAPGTRFAGQVRSGDLLIRSIPGAPGRNHIAVVADSGVWPYERLKSVRLVPEKHYPGWYVQVIEKGTRSNGSHGRFAWLLVDKTGRLPRNQMLLRPKQKRVKAKEQGWNEMLLAEALPDMTLVQQKIDAEIERVRTAYPSLAIDLKEVTLRGHMTADEFAVHVIGEEKALLYPIQVRTAQAGFYLLKWNGAGKALYLIDLATGKEPKTLPDPPLLAGGREWEQLRRGRVGVIWITVTVTEPPAKRPLQPEDLEFPLHYGYEVLEEKFRLMLEKNPPHPLAIPGVTGGIFFSNHVGESGQRGYYGRPLNFIYYTHDGGSAAVSRQLAGREFYYIVPIDDIQSYLRTYALEYAGLASMGSAIIAQMLVDMGLNFVPVLGPLYGLLQCAQSVVAAYENWETMSGWEVAIVGLDVFLNLVPIVYTGVKVVRGAKAYSKGVASLVKAGLPKIDAHRLMLGGGIFQSEKSARRIVDSLSDMLRRGGRFGVQEIKQAEEILRLMLEQLPAFERQVIAAALATQSRQAMRQFFDGTALLKRHLDGLTQLNPRTLVILKGIAKSHPDLVQRIACWVEQAPDVAKGIDKLEAALKDAHLPEVLGQIGAEVLDDLGRSSIILATDLADYVQNASNATEAYTRLMQGASRKLANGTKPKGLIAILTTARSGSLPPVLSLVQQQFSHLLLSVNQLRGLSQLKGPVREILSAAADGHLRSIATMADASGDVVTAMNNLAPDLPAHFVPEVLDRLGQGMLQIAGRTGYKLSSALVGKVGGQTLASDVIDTLLKGFSRTTTPVPGAGRVTTTTPGMLDELADALKTTTNIQSMLADIEFPQYQAELFARWAVARQSSIKGIATVLTHRAADARKKISDIFLAFDYDGALDVFDSLEQIERLSGASLQGLERMIAELAAGGNKVMGASFTLTYVMQRFGGRVGGFEVPQSRVLGQATPTRHYDLFAGGIYYEFKHWSGFGGEAADKAADEFARDVLLHVDTNFSQLRWVIHRQAEPHRLAIESMLRGVIARPEVQKGLAELGITSAEALRRLEAATGLLEFYD